MQALVDAGKMADRAVLGLQAFRVLQQLAHEDQMATQAGFGKGGNSGFGNSGN